MVCFPCTSSRKNEVRFDGFMDVEGREPGKAIGVTGGVERNEGSKIIIPLE